MPKFSKIKGSRAKAGARALNLGISAVEAVIPHAMVHIEDGGVRSDSVESLRWLLGKLGVVAAFCLTLAAQCRHAKWEALA